MLCFAYSVGKEDAVNEEFKRADAVVLTYSCGDSASFERLSTHWLPELQKLEVGDWFCFFLLSFSIWI